MFKITREIVSCKVSLFEWIVLNLLLFEKVAKFYIFYRLPKLTLGSYNTIHYFEEKIIGRKWGSKKRDIPIVRREMYV